MSWDRLPFPCWPMTRFVGSYPRAREGNLFVAVSDISAGKNHQTANTNLASIYMSHSGITFSVLVINRFHRLIMYSKVYSWLCVGVDYEPPAVSMIWSYESFIFNFFWLKVLKFGLLELICKPITGFRMHQSGLIWLTRMNGYSE